MLLLLLPGGAAGPASEPLPAIDPARASLLAESADPFAIDPARATLLAESSDPFAIDPARATLLPD